MRKFLLVLLSFVLAPIAYSQTPAIPTPGTPPFGSFQTSGFDTVNRYNMNVNFSIPIVISAGRGQPFNFSIVYDSSVWTNAGLTYWATNKGGGWKTQLPQGNLFYLTQAVRCDNGLYYTRYYSFKYTDAAGTAHPFGLSFYQANPCDFNPQSPQSGYASDSSGFYLTANNANGVIKTKSGAIVGAPQLIDSNGNIVSSTTNGSETDWTDSAGHLTLKVITSSSQIQYEYPDTSGTYQITTLKVQNYNVKTNFACSGITEYTGTQSLPYELDLVNGQKYTFSYEATPGNTGYVTGRVQRVTLPTGGYYEYDYGATNDGIYCSDGSTVSMNRVVNDGTNSNTWQYSRALVSGSQVTTATDPASNAATYTFNTSAQETSEKHYLGSTSGTLLRTANMTWAANGTPATAITILEDNSTQSEVETTYDTYGNLLTLKEHDWGTPGTILRTTTNTYLSTSPYITANILDRPTLTTIADSSGTKSRTVIAYDESGYINTPCISGAAQHDDAGHGCSYTVRGNPTTVTRYTDANTPSGPITKHNTYDSLGNVVGADVDCCRHEQFNFSATTQYAYPDSTVIGTAPNQFTATYTYSTYNGLMATSTDPNHQPGSYAYDNMLRPSSVNYPDGGQTSYSYSTEYGGTYAQITEKMDASHNRVSYVWSDGIGRRARVAVTNGESQPYDETLSTCFNSVGLASLQGYPFQDGGWNNPISCSVAGDSYIYDALGRPKTVTHADNSSGSISYTTNCATATDEQGKSRKVCSDGLGRVTSIAENPGGLNYTTTYAYDALNNLTTVTQGAETRTFVYDGLSRLTSATNPESGATSYTYDAYSHVATRTDARSIVTTYSYDAAERLTSKTYSDGTPTAGFYYDQPNPWGNAVSNYVGRLTTEQAVNGNVISGFIFGYDPMGRVNYQGQCAPQTCGWSGYVTANITHDLIGDLTSYHSPWGFTVTRSYNTAGRVTQISSSMVDSQHPGTLVSGAHYNGAGGTTSYLLGNNLTETAAYNGLVQPCRMNVNSSATLVSSCTGAPPSGNLLDLTTGFNYGSGDNGNVMSWAAAGQQTFNRSYTYDGVNRLYTMSAPGSTCSGLSWSYDQWGNRTGQTVTGGTCGSSQLTFNSYNHVTNPGFQYDAAGNMTHDANHSYTYDAENRVTQVDGGATAKYAYDPLGYRVEKIAGGVTTEYVYDPEGHVAVDANWTCGQSCWSAAYFYLNGSPFAEYTSSSTEFLSGDHLGSTRLLTNISGGVVDNMDYLPFGEQIAGASGTTHKFTGYERDSETGLDNAQARYNSSSLGRFMSPDPIGNFVADATNPQTWNMYAYVNNNPLLYIDPTGLDGSGYWDCIGSGNDPSNCGAPPIALPCDASGCIVYVNGDAPTWDRPQPCSGGCTPATGGGGGGTGGGGKKSFGTCVAEGGKIFSLQGILQFASGGHLGNGFLSNVFLGNSVSAGIEIAQALQSGNSRGIAGAAAPELAGRLAGPAATLGANAMPNVAVGMSVTQVTATSTSLTVEGFSAALSLKPLAQAGASALNVGLKTLEAPKAVVDATGAVFGVAICGMMR